MPTARCALLCTVFRGAGSELRPLGSGGAVGASRWAAVLTPVPTHYLGGACLCARLEFIATTERLFLKDKQTCFLILLIQNVSWELDFRVEYNYSFLSELTHHSWEPNLVEKTKFCVVLPDMKSERFVYEMCWKYAVPVFSSCMSGAQVDTAWLRKPNDRGGAARSRPCGPSETILNMYNLPNSLAKLPENDVVPCSPVKMQHGGLWIHRLLLGRQTENGTFRDLAVVCSLFEKVLCFLCFLM